MPISISSASLVFVFSDSGSSPTDYITNDPTLTLEIAVTAAQDTTDNSVLGIWLTGGAFSTGTLVGQITETVAGGPVYELFDLTTSSVPAATSLAEGDYNIIVTRGTTGVGTDVLAQHSLTVDTTPPGAPLISTVTDDVGPVTGNVADGGSTDRTRAIVQRLAAEFANLTLIDNPGRLQSAGINHAVTSCAGPGHRILLRADAHALYPPGYAMRAAELLVEKRAASVVVPMLRMTELLSGICAAQARWASVR